MIPDMSRSNRIRAAPVLPRMRRLAVFLSVAASAFPQHLSVGIKGGVPLSSLLDAPGDRFPYLASTKRYTLGPALEVRLPWRLGLEVNALYKRFGYSRDFTDITTIGSSPVLVNARTRATGNHWEFPLLLKFRLADGPLFRPYVSAGASFNRVSAKEATEFFVPAGSGGLRPFANTNPPQLQNRTGRGFVLGGELELNALFLRLTPELRYTRWGVANFRDINGLLNSNQNQAELLLGITF